MFQKTLRGLFSAAVLRNILIAIGAVLVDNGKLDPGQWETISGAILIIVNMIFAGLASVQSRVVTADGKKVPLSKLPASTETLVREKAETVASRNDGPFGGWLKRTFSK